MTKEPVFPKSVGPFCNISNHNLVLQLMEEEERRRGPIGDDEDIGWEEHSAQVKEKKRETERAGTKGYTDEDRARDERRKAELERKGAEFRHTAEYYELIKDEKERKRAYKGLILEEKILVGKDAEIANNPFKFLYLPQDATLGQVRAAQITLSKMWHPDLMNPKNREQRDRIFCYGADFSLRDMSLEEFVEKIINASPPETLSEKELEKLSPRDRVEYGLKKEEYMGKEMLYEKVKADMVTRATEKMKVINQAYREALRHFSDNEVKSLAGYRWEKGAYTSSVISSIFASFALGFSELHWERTYDSLSLEGEGAIRRNTGELACDREPYLAYDWGEIYLGDDNYRQAQELRTLFAWVEMRQGKELCPTLLDGIQEAYKLSESQTEQLRLMLMNHEEPDFILETIGIEQDIRGTDHFQILRFIDEVYDGPTYSIHNGPLRESYYFSLGVELTTDGKLILTLMRQGDAFFCISEKSYAQFSPNDVQMMQSLAYGPLLKDLN
jgi:hypothetical protein